MWRITEDHISSPEEGKESNDWRDRKGWFNQNPQNVERFKLYDDDGILYYEGEAHNLVTGFEPLEWAMWNAGCTYIEYYNPRKKTWEIL